MESIDSCGFSTLICAALHRRLHVLGRGRDRHRGDAARRDALVDGEYICTVFGKNSEDGRQHALPVEQLEVERHQM